MSRFDVEPNGSEEFWVDVGLRQGSALSTLMFIAVVEVSSRREGGRDGVGVREIFTRTLVSSRLKWAGHVDKWKENVKG